MVKINDITISKNKNKNRRKRFTYNSNNLFSRKIGIYDTNTYK